MVTGKNGKRIAAIFMILLGIIWIVPIFWLIINSFKTDSDFITSFANVKGPVDYLSRMIPRKWTVVNYIEMFVGGSGTNTTSNILAMFKNSFIVSISQMVLIVVIDSLAAYAYERLPFKGGNAIFWALMYISMFPNVVNLLPMFRIANALGWVNNLNALIWPGICGVFNIFLIRNFMKGIPKALVGRLLREVEGKRAHGRRGLLGNNRKGIGVSRDDPDLVERTTRSAVELAYELPPDSRRGSRDDCDVVHPALPKAIPRLHLA